MSRILNSERTIDLMVNCKTYPSISTKYFETVCTGGVQPDGEFVRLYPIPFRMLDRSQQYERWEVIRVKAYRDSKDTRPESWHFEPGTPIEIIQKITTERDRWDWMRKCMHVSRAAMEAKGITNGCVRIEPTELYWSKDDNELSPDQLNTLRQGNLYDNEALKEALIERVPYQFRLKFREVETGLVGDCKVLAWSYYQGFRRRQKEFGEDKKAMDVTADAIRKSICDPKRTIFAIFGTHIHWGSWMISSLYYVESNVIAANSKQELLF